MSHMPDEENTMPSVDPYPNGTWVDISGANLSPAAQRANKVEIQQGIQDVLDLGNRYSPVTFTDVRSALDYATTTLWIMDLSGQTGYLPYSGIQTYLRNEDLDLEQLAARFEECYSQCWPTVRADMEARVGRCRVDAETKDLFMEGLEAHERGLYRLVCSSLLTGLERPLRAHWHSNTPSVKFNPQKYLQGLVTAASPSWLMAGTRFWVTLLSRLQREVFAPAAGEWSRRTGYRFPRRHAAAHGVYHFPSRQDSINVLIITLYLFQVLSEHDRTGRAS